ncbi:MAG: hypothetical protein PHT12_00055 [Patescibacteria group bacterium]|nr:hypothetical protein [Patescibacteria group bacterium]
MSANYDSSRMVRKHRSDGAGVVIEVFETFIGPIHCRVQHNVDEGFCRMCGKELPDNEPGYLIRCGDREKIVRNSDDETALEQVLREAERMARDPEQDEDPTEPEPPACRRGGSSCPNGPCRKRSCDEGPCADYSRESKRN